jgi:hypothetical protein
VGQYCKSQIRYIYRENALIDSRIYGIRYALMSYFAYRIRNTEAYLKKLNKERDATIERLKEATKYNSTQQLLEKYGASTEGATAR